jgi:hypothetical protein
VGAAAAQSAPPASEPAAAVAGPLTLAPAGLRVALDAQLPRPTRVTHLRTATDFSPPRAGPPAGRTPAGPPPAHWWRRVDNHALLDAKGGESCSGTPHCHALPHTFPVGQGTAKCEAACEAAASCVAWNLLKDTPASGQHGKGDLCLLFEQGGLAKAGPHYAVDGNFACGSKAQLQPAPPAHGGGAGPGPAQPIACVGVVSINGSVTQFCGDEASTVYSARTSNATSDGVRWRLTLSKPELGITVTLAGTVAAETDPAAAHRSVLSWSLLSAQSAQLRVRAVDLGFAFVGLSGKGDRYYYTHSSKTWCPPGVGCGEWATATATGTVGVWKATVSGGSVFREGWARDKSDCHFRKTATEYDRKPGIKWLSCTAK